MTETHNHVAEHTASAALLHRPVPVDYRVEQTEKIATPLSQGDHTQTCSLVIFRLAQEWFALPAGLCSQVLSPLKPHTLPHRSNDTLLGIVNVRGQMLLKVSLRSLLCLQDSEPTLGVTASARDVSRAYSRMMVIEKAATSERERSSEIAENAPETPQVWAFDVDELEGIHSIALNIVEAPPMSVETSTTACTQRIFLWQGHRVSWLNDHQLFEALRHRAL